MVIWFFFNEEKSISRVLNGQYYSLELVQLMGAGMMCTSLLSSELYTQAYFSAAFMWASLPLDAEFCYVLFRINTLDKTRDIFKPSSLLSSGFFANVLQVQWNNCNILHSSINSSIYLN